MTDQLQSLPQVAGPVVENVVNFKSPQDPANPKNWSSQKKYITLQPVWMVLATLSELIKISIRIYTSTIVAYTTFVSSWGSAILSPGLAEISELFHVSAEDANLVTSLFVLGFAAGPLVWAPFSERKGRRIPLSIATFGYALFTIAVASANDIQTVLICRFWAGAFASAPLALIGAFVSDMFDFAQRGTAVAILSIMVFLGPIMSPVVGAFIVDSYLEWRWTEYLTAIMAFVALVLQIVFLDETYAPALLASNANKLRLETKNMSFYATHELEAVTFNSLLDRNINRPLRLLFGEVILFLVCLYMAFVYGLLYSLLLSYPFVFVEKRGWALGVGTLPYLGVGFGMILGCISVIAFQPWINRRTVKNNNIPVPENRLPLAILGAVIFTIGLFWFAWGGNQNSTPWIVPTLGGLPIGFGFITIFLSLLNYIVDTYLIYAASAIAANTFLRSLVGAVFPLFTTQMYERLGVGWGGSLLGFIALGMVPIPVLFYIFGRRLREKSPWASTGKK